MAIIIPSKNIYSIEHQKSLSNRIKNVGADVNRVTVYFDQNAQTYSPEITIGRIWDITFYEVGAIQYRRTEQYYLDIDYVFTPNANLGVFFWNAQAETEKVSYASVPRLDPTILDDQNKNDPIRNHIDFNSITTSIPTTEIIHSEPPLLEVDEGAFQWDLAADHPLTLEEVAENTYRIKGRIRTRTVMAITPLFEVENSSYYENTLKSFVITMKAQTVKTDSVSKVFDESLGETSIIINANELLQENTTTENQKTWFYISDRIVNEYEKGKEIIRLKCSISDYFDEDGNKVIDTQNANINLINTRQLPKSLPPVDDNIYQYPISLTAGDYSTKLTIKDRDDKINGLWEISFYDVDDNKIYSTNNVSDKSNEQITFYISQDQAEKIYYARIWVNASDKGVGGKEFSVMIVKGETLPDYEPRKSMCFEIDDTVIPKSYTASREDAPMSTKKDGSEKKFSVIGVNMSYDGAVFQDLTLQEIAE